jgi:hypothetical protein
MNRLDPKTGILHDMAFDVAHPQLARRLRRRRFGRRETTIPGIDAGAADTATVLRVAAEEAIVAREQQESATGIRGYGRLK